MAKVHNEGPATINLIIVDDHELARASMRHMLAIVEPDLRVIAEAKDGQEATELCHLHRPHLVLMDMRMPRMNGLEATQAIKEELPATKILMVSAEHVSVSELARSGAEGYVSKVAPLEELLDTIRGVLHDEPQYSPYSSTR
jgi:DNA-binding NarL/FixJ family response regulator